MNSAAAGVNHGQLSAIENGRLLPADDVLETLEREYGAALDEWYPARVLLALELDDDRPALAARGRTS